MAKHMKNSAGKKIRNAVIFGLAVCAAAGITAGAVVGFGSGKGTSEGNLLPETLILEEKQVMTAQPNGGFLLVTTNGSTETNAMFLTQDGSLAEGSANYRSILGRLERVFAQNNTAYITTSSNDGTTMTGSILQIPLDGSQFANAVEFVFDNTVRQIDMKTVCVDAAGDCYAIARGTNQVLRLDLSDIEYSVPLTIGLDGIGLNGLAIAEETVYLSGADGSVWTGTLYDDEILGLSRQESAGVDFPVTFLNGTTVLDADNDLFTLHGGTFADTGASFYGGADMDEDGTLAAITAENEIALFENGDYTVPTGTWLYAGDICAVACNDGIGALLREENHHRGILLDASAFAPEEAPDNSPEDGEEEVPVKDGMISSAPTSQPEPEQPAASEPESGTASSKLETVLTDRIISSRHPVDSTTGTVTLPAGTTLAQFRKTVPLGTMKLAAATETGEAFSGGKLGTGMRLQLLSGEEMLDEVVVIVKGDLNGNGAVNSADERLLYQHLTGEQLLTDYHYTASDLDENGAVNTRDLLLLKQLYQ